MEPGDGVPLLMSLPVLDGGVGDGAETGDGPVDLHGGVGGVGGGVQTDGVGGGPHLQRPGVAAQPVGGHTLVLPGVLPGHVLQYEGLVGGVAGHQHVGAGRGEQEVVVVPAGLTGGVALHQAAEMELPLPAQQLRRPGLNSGAVWTVVIIITVIRSWLVFKQLLLGFAQ